MTTVTKKLPGDALEEVLDALQLTGIPPGRRRNDRPGGPAGAAWWRTRNGVEVLADHHGGVTVTMPDSHPFGDIADDIRRQYSTPSAARRAYDAAIAAAYDEFDAAELQATAKLSGMRKRAGLLTPEAAAEAAEATEAYQQTLEVLSRRLREATETARREFREAWKRGKQ